MHEPVGEGDGWLPEAPDEVLAVLVQHRYFRKEAFEELIKRYWQRIKDRFMYSYGVKLETAEDLTQKVWLNLYKNDLAGFDPRRRFAPWLYAVVRNSFVSDVVRPRRPDSLGADAEGPVCESAAAEAEHREAERRIDDALAQLSPAAREVLKLSMEGDAPRELARSLNMPVGRVYKVLEHARSSVRRFLKLDGADDDPPESGRIGA